ncbi:thioredoxin family protein [Candidatus Daviesbacteria bacterium]|nr:thioredoxin family protein [Candidatus Daviesbacteria bacterium]
MAVESSMLPLGTKAPNFSLTDVTSGTTVSVSDFENKKAFLIMFICRHCPYVQHVQKELSQIGKDYQEKDIAIVAISSNDITSYPEDAPESLKEQATKLMFIFPYLYDGTQEVAKDYSATCTPDLFLFDADRKLVYRGQLDDSRPGNNIPVTGKDLRAAIDAILSGQLPASNQKPSIGCSIKWRH